MTKTSKNFSSSKELAQTNRFFVKKLLFSSFISSILDSWTILIIFVILKLLMEDNVTRQIAMAAIFQTKEQYLPKVAIRECWQGSSSVCY
jgi:hypothetical protein